MLLDFEIILWKRWVKLGLLPIDATLYDAVRAYPILWVVDDGKMIPVEIE